MTDEQSKIVPYEGPDPIPEYIEAVPGTSHIVMYSCGIWMVTDGGKFPAHCPQCGRDVVAFHKTKQEILELLLATSDYRIE